MRKRILFHLIVIALSGVVGTAYAVQSYLNSFVSTYPGASSTQLNSCTLCHSSLSTYSLNSYGTAYANAGHNFRNIESLDSDGDGYSNLT